MKAIDSLYRSMLIPKEQCPLRRTYCVDSWNDRPKRCKYSDHIIERRDETGWIGFTMYCNCDKPQVVQLSLFD